MVSKSKVIKTKTKCSCGAGNESAEQESYFVNKCPACGKEGTLQVETINNMEIDNNKEDDEDKNDSSEKGGQKGESPNVKIVCKNCGAEYCGQDGYDLAGGTRGSLTKTNPNDITDDDENEVSSEEEEDSTYMSGWEGLCDLLKPLDGLAMMVQRGDCVVVKKIEMPEYAKLWAYEGINVVDDSVKITDYTPEIYNTFVILWGETFENELEFVFNRHKELFGERKVVIEAKKIKSTEEGEDTKNKDKDKNKGGGIFDFIFNFGKGNDDSEDTDDKSSKNVDDNDDKTKNEESGGEGSDDEEDKEGNTEEVPITDREEAIQFGLTEVGKAKREDGHTIELKVIGSIKWEMGEWCHVRLPSFNEDCYMFITKCNFESGPDNEFIHSLTLADYPPSLGKKSKKSSDSDSVDASEDEDKNTEDTDKEKENEESNNNESSSSSESSSNNDK